MYKLNMRVTDTQFVQDLAAPVEALGQAGFEERLLAFLGRMVRHDMRTLTRYSRYDKPDYLVYSDSYPSEMAERYLQEFYRFDPFYLYWRRTERPGIVWLGDLASPAVKQSRYMREFLSDSGVSDEIGLFLPPFGRASVALFLERRSGRFSTAERARLGRLYPLTASLYKAHVAALLGGPGIGNGGDGFGNRGAKGAGKAGGLSLPATRPLLITDRSGGRVFANAAWCALEKAEGATLGHALETARRAVDPQSDLGKGRILHRDSLAEDFRLAPGGSLWSLEATDSDDPAPPEDPAAFFRADLTARELDVVSLILKGYPTLSIAQRLGLSRGTVKNHRRRIYDKLDITTERELFLAYIGRITAK